MEINQGVYWSARDLDKIEFIYRVPNHFKGADVAENKLIDGNHFGR